MDVPSEFRYSEDHEWALVDATRAKIGITDFAQDALGDVVFVRLPEAGAVAARGDVIGEVESTKSVSDIYAPVSGRIVEVNTALGDAPERLNEDPYGQGWICVVEMDSAADLDALMDAASYTEFTSGSSGS
ncbi:MAG: glycine cleavage system protein GcvH [Actinomycetota bacterium]|jgi:glycine cleavage system H protein|nr:glycine cleavage system protein GcvH [Actinomycetota bacterium]